MADAAAPADDDLAQIREAVRALCAGFPGEYWRAPRPRARLSDRVRRRAHQGRLPRRADPGGVRRRGLAMAAATVIMEEIQAAGCNGAACHAQMYTMGTLLRHGSAEQKARWLPRIASGELRLQAFGVTEPSAGSDTLNLRTTAVREGDRLHHQRPEDLDLARRAFRSAAAARAHHAARAGAAPPKVSRSFWSTCVWPRAPASSSIRSAP